MKSLFLLPLLVPLLVSAPARAETPEEAVAYAFLGLADGGTIARASTTMAWKQAAPSPAVYDGYATVKGKTIKLRFTVRAADPCHYDIVLEGPGEFVPGEKRLYARVALDKVAAVAPGTDGFTAKVTGDGFCVTGPSSTECAAVDNSDLFATVDAARYAASAALLSTVCKPVK